MTNIPISYYKLKDIDVRFNIVKSYYHVVDLGCFPGGWSNYIYDKGVRNLYMIDYYYPTFFNNGFFIKGDFSRLSVYKILIGKKFNLICSDIFCKSSHISFLNNFFNSNSLSSLFKFAFFFLKEGGSVLLKTTDHIVSNNKLIDNLAAYFLKFTRIKCLCSKKKSSEIYLYFNNFLSV